MLFLLFRAHVGKSSKNKFSFMMKEMSQNFTYILFIFGATLNIHIDKYIYRKSMKNNEKNPYKRSIDLHYLC